MADYKLIIKYIKVRALAQKGSPGERDNAARMLRKMEQEHPGLKNQVFHFERKQSQPHDNTPPGVTPKWRSKQGTVWQNLGNWENLFQYAQTAVHTAYGVAEAYARAQRGAEMARYVDLKTALSSTGEIVVSFKIPPARYREMVQLEDAQKAALKRELQLLLHDELNRLLG